MSRSPGQNFRRGDTPRFALPLLLFYSIGFEEYAVNFEQCKVDGDLLLTLTEEDLNSSLKMNCRITHKR